MSPLSLPFSPRFITLTLAVVSTLLFGIWLYTSAPQRRPAGALPAGR